MVSCARWSWLVTAVLCGVLLGLGAPKPAAALVDAALQPHDLFERYGTVLALRVAEIDEADEVVVLAVTGRPKGTFAPEQVRLTVDGEEALEAFYSAIMPDQPMVAFLDAARGRDQGKVLFYAADGHWGMAEQDGDDAAQWRWTEHLAPNGRTSMFGVFNGRGDRLAEMMADAADERDYFPARPFTRFAEERVIAELPSPAQGLALHDITGDGHLEVVAVSPEACRVLVRTGTWTFEDRAETLGLSGAGGPSVGVADVNADGRADLLIGGQLYLQQAGGRFERSSLLPHDADEQVKVASFVEINGDGWPDVVVSRSGAGLAVYLHGGADGAGYRDASAQLRLDAVKAADAGPGFFAPGDWNDDGRTDLFHAVGDGRLLLQDEDGRFEAHDRSMQLDFAAADARGTGAATLAPLWRSGSTDLVVATEAGVRLFISENGSVTDAASYGNEITEGEPGLLGALAEDLNADGNVDVYAINAGRSSNLFYMNRGYGSFMLPRKYGSGMFPGAAHDAGAHSAVAGDVNGDGANDLVLGTADGSVVILVNQTLAGRGEAEYPTAQERVLGRTSILSVTVEGPLGVLGAEVVLADDAGKVVGRRMIGSQVLTGNRGPDAVNLAVRDPGAYELSVCWSDGLARRWPIDLAEPAHHRHFTATREAESNQQ